MPVQKVGRGYRWGEHGKVYYGIDAKEKAMQQGKAISISKARAKGHDVPPPKPKVVKVTATKGIGKTGSKGTSSKGTSSKGTSSKGASSKSASSKGTSSKGTSSKKK